MIKEDSMELEIGMTYEDPEGIWEIVGFDRGFVDVKQIQEDNVSYGMIFCCPREEVEYYMQEGFHG